MFTFVRSVFGDHQVISKTFYVRLILTIGVKSNKININLLKLTIQAGTSHILNGKHVDEKFANLCYICLWFYTWRFLGKCWKSSQENRKGNIQFSHGLLGWIVILLCMQSVFQNDGCTKLVYINRNDINPTAVSKQNMEWSRHGMI